jgi:hypothetical protein
LALFFTREGGHHDNLDVFCLGSATQDIEHVKPANLRHHDITYNQVWTIFDRHCQSLFPITSGNDVVTFRKEADAVNLT